MSTQPNVWSGTACDGEMVSAQSANILMDEATPVLQISRVSHVWTLDTGHPALICSLHAATLDYFRSFHVNTETLGTKLFNLFRHINLIVTLECFMTHLSFDPVYNFTIKPSQKPRCPGSGGLVGSVWLVSLIFLFITSACCPVIINCG